MHDVHPNVPPPPGVRSASGRKPVSGLRSERGAISALRPELDLLVQATVSTRPVTGRLLDFGHDCEAQSDIEFGMNKVMKLLVRFGS